MGALFSRGKHVVSDGDEEGVITATRLEEIPEETRTDLQRWEQKQEELNWKTLQQMKTDLVDRPHYLLANLLVLSVQFFENFEKEREAISRLCRDKELTLGDQLAPYCRRAKFLGAHEETSAPHALYHPRGVEFYELSGPRQIVVIQDNVQLYPETEFEALQSAEYTEMDGGPLYRLCVEPSKRHPGYVRLRCVDLIPGITRHNTYENIYRNLPPLDDADFDPMLDPRPLHQRADNELPGSSEMFPGKRNTERLKLTNGLVEDSTDPVQPTTKYLELRRKSDSMRKIIMSNKEGKSVAAFKLLQEKLAGIEEDSDEERSDTDSEDDNEDEDAFCDGNKSEDSIKDIIEESKTDTEDSDSKGPELHANIRTECFITRRFRIRSMKDVYDLKSTEAESRLYISSERYRATFEDDFPEFLKVIKEEHLIDSVHAQDSMVVTRDLYKNSLMIETQYIPGFACSEWPLCALEWKLRDRKSNWPKPRVIGEVVHSGVTVVPMGYHNPRSPNRIMLIEWQYQFFKAEQILLRSLGHLQIRLLFTVQLLFRDHIEKDGIRILKSQHLRYVLFWLCEHNYQNWHEANLTMKLKTYLKSLYEALAKEHLPHYFMNSVNMLDTIKESQVRQIQEAVKRIMDNMPLYLYHTLTRMRYKEGFYPLLDFKRLYNLISVKRYGLEEINPALVNQAEEMEEESSEEEQDDEDRALQMRLMAEYRRRQSVYQIDKKDPEAGPQRKNSVDLGVFVEKINDLRVEKLLTLFAKHFIQIAVFSNRHGDHAQAMRYLLYAGNLLDVLLDEEVDCPQSSVDDLQHLLDKIKSEKAETRKGLNRMISYTHKLTYNCELVKVYTKPSSNWELKKKESVKVAQDRTESKAESVDTEVSQPSTSRQTSTKLVSSETKSKSYTEDRKAVVTSKFSGLGDRESSILKSLPTLDEDSSQNQSTKSESQSEKLKDSRTVKFDVFSEDEEDSTDL